MKENQPSILEHNCSACKTWDTDQVVNTETNTRQGWLCNKCGEFTKAIGRERVWKKSFLLAPLDEYIAQHNLIEEEHQEDAYIAEYESNK